jgi:class 3 adenylate cyclase
MTVVQNTFLRLWDRVSHTGVSNQPYSEARRLILCNQVALLGAIIPQFYNIFYFYYDYELLKPVIVVNLAGSFICLLVLSINHFSFHKTAKAVIAVSPNIQIFLLTYYMSTASGMHLLHIMMLSFIFFLFSNERKIIIATVVTIPLALYIYSFIYFTPETSPIILDAGLLVVFYIFISLTVFFLVMLFFALFYREILYTENLLQNEYERSERLLLNILPEEVAIRLKNDPGIIAEQFPSATILFADIVGFTGITTSVEPARLVTTLNEIFSRFDKLTDHYQLEKIKTIGDAYMVAGGIPKPMENHTEVMANMALDMLDEVNKFNFGDMQLSLRIGFHTGPVVAGVIGARKFSYDIWGDAVNLASRLESHSLSGRIHVSMQVYELLKDKYSFEDRGEIPVKGLGNLHTWFLTGKLGK